MKDLNCALLVIGGGPGGYVCAIRACQLGIDTILVESDSLGGTCLNVGCIPSKALIHIADKFHDLHEAAESSQTGLSVSGANLDFGKSTEWRAGIVKRLNRGVEGLLKKSKVRIVRGQARFIDGKTMNVTTGDSSLRIRAENVVIATGSEAVELPSLPFGDLIMSSTDALALTTVPESLAVVGGGYIGLELGTAFAKLGASVTIIEAADRLLPLYDAALVKPVLARLKSLGVRVVANTTASAAEDQTFASNSVQITMTGASGEQETTQFERVLVTVGRRARIASVGIDEVEILTFPQPA